MPASELTIAAVAAAILEGTPVDWPTAESGATEDDRQILEELRLLSAVAGVHRALPPEAGSTSEATGEPRYWGRLRLVERVGRGTFGEVHRAWDPRLHREVALKLIPSAGDDGDGRSAAIIREARLLARVRHPGVVTLYDAEAMDTMVGLSMEFVEGPTLELRLQQQGVFTPAETVDIGVQLCDALSAAHDAGVLHRDVKASNVVVKGDGRIVLMDFGAGRQLDDAFTTDSTGTPLYLAPEVLHGLEATVRSDVYSLGVLLHYMLTGSYPVQADSLPELRAAHARRTEGQLDGRPSPAPDIPEALARVLERAIDPRPERRYESAAALGDALHALTRTRGARGRWVALLAAAVAVMTVGGWLLATRGSAHEPVRFAVLPFVVTGGDADDGLLREGMAKDLISRLQVFENARVTSTASVSSIAQLNLPLAEVASRLGVSDVVTGRVSRAGDTVVVEARLVGFPGARQRWSRQYRRPASELLDLQRAIAMDLAEALKLLRPPGLQEWPTRNLDAYALCVRAQVALDRYTPDGIRIALRLFEQALELDPGYARAHAGLAQVYVHLNPGETNVNREDALRRATDAAARALSLDPSLPDAHVAAALVKSAEADWDGAERGYRRAIELGPSHVVARQEFAKWLSLLGRFDEAIEQARVAESLDPLSPRAIMAVASALRFARRFEEAIPQAQKALDVDPGHLMAYHNLGLDYQGLNRLDEAIAAFERTGRPSGNLGHAYAQAGRTAEARALIAQFEKRYEETGLGAGHIAQIYCGLGEIDRAFEWLELDERTHTGPSTFKVAPVWDPLRSDPRFTALLKRYGLAD